MKLDIRRVNLQAYPLDMAWVKVISSAALLGQEKSIVILHDGQRYTLSITKLRKLILTK